MKCNVKNGGNKINRIIYSLFPNTGTTVQGGDGFCKPILHLYTAPGCLTLSPLSPFICPLGAPTSNLIKQQQLNE